MRIIRFRGYDSIADTWRFGGGVVKDKDIKDRYWLMFSEGDGIIIDKPETIGQFTGLKDKDGRERYESDLYEIRVNGIETHVEDVICEVKWSDIVGGFGFHRLTKDSEQPDWIGMTDKNILSLKYLGNRFENPELLND